MAATAVVTASLGLPINVKCEMKISIENEMVGRAEAVAATTATEHKSDPNIMNSARLMSKRIDAQ